jgi:GNAT superfamily N-acetyltransferase
MRTELLSFSDFLTENVKVKDQKLQAFFDELSKRGTLQTNPFNPRELIYNEEAMLEINRFDKQNRDEISLQDIAVFDKSQGIGNKVMKAITDSADELGYKITLDAKPFGTDPKALNIEKLVEFYKKHGFIADLKAIGGFRTESALVKYAKKYKEAVPMYREAK